MKILEKTPRYTIIVQFIKKIKYNRDVITEPTIYVSCPYISRAHLGQKKISRCLFWNIL